MMEMKTIERELRRHPLFDRQIPVQLQLGLPRLYAQQDRLFLCYRMHRQTYRDGQLQFYPVEYEIRLVYPFSRIVYFEELDAALRDGEKMPVRCLPAEGLLRQGGLLRELYQLAERTIAAWETGADGEEALAEYARAFEWTVECLGLRVIYGG